MRAFVTGGRGYIGSRLVERLRGDGWMVELMDYDVRDTVVWGETPDVIYHLAAVTRNQPSILAPGKTMEVNIVGTANILAAASIRDVPVVYASSNVVYSEIRTPYQISKKAADEYAHFRMEKGQRIAILRFGDVYGKGMKSGLFHVWRQQFEASGCVELWGGEQTRDYVHVSDVVEALVLANGHSGPPMDICTGMQTTFREVARLLGVPAKANMTNKGREVALRLVQAPKVAKEAIGFTAKVDIRDGIEEIREEWGLEPCSGS